MINQTLDCYAKALIETGCTKEQVSSAAEIFDTYPSLSDILYNPTISIKEKESVIDKLFSGNVANFIKVVCRNGENIDILEVFTIFFDLTLIKEDTVQVIVEYVTPLTPEQEKGFQKFACNVSGKKNALLITQYHPELIGGFIVRIGDFLYDQSFATKFNIMRQNLIRR